MTDPRECFANGADHCTGSHLETEQASVDAVQMGWHSAIVITLPLGGPSALGPENLEGCDESCACLPAEVQC